MKSFLFYSLYLFFLLSPRISVADGKLSTGEKYLENFLAHTRTMQADFRQVLRAENGEVLQQTEGKFYLSRPGKFRWNYMAPYKQKIISDGHQIWIYDVDLAQVTVQKSLQSLNTTPMALLDNRMKLHQQFNVVALDHRDGIYRLKLLSKKANTDFGEIVVGLDKHGLRFLQLHDQFKQVTNIVFSHIKINKHLAASLFQFKPPAGVNVYRGG